MEDFQVYVESAVPGFLDVSVTEREEDTGRTVVEIAGEDGEQTYRGEIPEPNHDGDGMGDIIDRQIISMVNRLTEAAMEDRLEDEDDE